MTWPDQNPPAADVLLHLNVPCVGGGTPARLEIDKLADGRYRATVGTLFEHQEICDLEALVRQATPWRRADPLTTSSLPSERCGRSADQAAAPRRSPGREAAKWSA